MNADSKLPSFSEWTAQIQQRTEVALAGVLPDPAVAPQRLHEAMRYAVLGAASACARCSRMRPAHSPVPRPRTSTASPARSS